LPRKALPQRRRGERLVDLGVEPLRDLLRQLGRPDDAVPLHAVEALEPRFLEGGHAGNQRVALEAGHGERLYLACAAVRQRRTEGCTTRTLRVPPTMATAVKSRMASYGSLRTAGLVPCVPT